LTIDDPAILDINRFKRKSVSVYVHALDVQHSRYCPAGKLLNEVSRLVDEGVLRTTMTERYSPINAANPHVHMLIESSKARQNRTGRLRRRCLDRGLRLGNLNAVTPLCCRAAASRHLPPKHQIIVNTIKEKFGTLHILVNNAGVMLDWTTTVFDIGLDTLTQTLHTNLYGFPALSALYSIDEGIRLLLFQQSFLSSTSFATQPS